MEGAGTVKLEKDDQGLRSATLGPLTPGFYSYLFTVDGVRTLYLKNATIEQGVASLDKLSAHVQKLSDPPPCRANKQRGQGSYENDRPPIVGTVGRRSGHCRLRVCEHTDGRTLKKQVQQFTKRTARCYRMARL